MRTNNSVTVNLMNKNDRKKNTANRNTFTSRDDTVLH